MWQLFFSPLALKCVIIPSKCVNASHITLCIYWASWWVRITLRQCRFKSILCENIGVSIFGVLEMHTPNHQNHLHTKITRYTKYVWLWYRNYHHNVVTFTFISHEWQNKVLLGLTFNSPHWSEKATDCGLRTELLVDIIHMIWLW